MFCHSNCKSLVAFIVFIFTLDLIIKFGNKHFCYKIFNPYFEGSFINTAEKRVLFTLSVRKRSKKGVIFYLKKDTKNSASAESTIWNVLIYRLILQIINIGIFINCRKMEHKFQCLLCSAVCIKVFDNFNFTTFRLVFRISQHFKNENSFYFTSCSWCCLLC